MYLLLCSHLRCVCFEDHGMRRDLTSTKALLSPSLPLLHWYVFYSYSIPFLYPLLSLSAYLFFSAHATLSFTFLSLLTFLSLHSLLHRLSVSYHSLSLPPLLLCLPFRSPSGSWSASWWTPGVAPWEEAVTTACASSSRPGSAQRPPGSPVG